MQKLETVPKTCLCRVSILDVQPLARQQYKFLEEKFGKNKAILDANIKVLKAGYLVIQQAFVHDLLFSLQKMKPGVYQ